MLEDGWGRGGGHSNRKPWPSRTQAPAVMQFWRQRAVGGQCPAACELGVGLRTDRKSRRAPLESSGRTCGLQREAAGLWGPWCRAPWLKSGSFEHRRPCHPFAMFLARLTSQLVRAVPGQLAASKPKSGCVPSLQGAQLELEEFLVPRKMAITPLESWLTARYLLPRLNSGAPVTVAPTQSYECPPSQVEEEAKEVWDVTPPIQCKNVLKIRRRKMNHHKYRKLIKRTRFLRRKVREGRLRRKQVKFERDLRRIWLKAGLKEAPAGWQTPQIYLKSK